MIKLTDLKDAHQGRAALILGGGPSLLGDVRNAHVSNPVLIGVNHHPQWVGIEPDYMVFMDNPMIDANLWQAARDFGGIKVTADLRYTDVHMGGVDYWNGPGSGIVACWLGLWMGCDPVLLCGMDLYQGEIKYCHEGEPDKAVFNITLDEHLKRWKAGFRRYPEMIGRVRAVSGPLVDVFERYDPASSTQVPPINPHKTA